MPDSREIIFSAKGALWRLGALSGGNPTRLASVGQDGASPVVTRTPDGLARLVYVRSFSDANVWRIDAPGRGAPASSPPVAAIASTRVDAIPNLSSDGRRITFVSNRAGEQEIWSADTDGSNAVAVTAMATVPGFPRWSPDGTQIAFHADPAGRPDVVVVPANGGKPRILTANTPGGAFPSFSRDGRWVYFCNNTDLRIWKVAAAGGPAIQVTSDPGAIAIESPDGQDLYYVAAADKPSAVWRMPVGGGAAVKLVDGVIFANFDVFKEGMYYIDRASAEGGGFYVDRPGAATRLQFFDFSSRRSTTVAHNLGNVGPGLSVTRDGRTIFFARVDSAVDELMLVENFR